MASAANKYQGQVVHGIEPTAKSNLLKQDEALEELVRVATKGDFFHPLFSTRTFLGPRKVSTPKALTEEAFEKSIQTFIN